MIRVSASAYSAMGIDDIYRRDIPQPTRKRRLGRGYSYLYEDEHREWLIERAQDWMDISSGFSDEDVPRERAAVRTFLRSQGVNA